MLFLISKSKGVTRPLPINIGVKCYNKHNKGIQDVIQGCEIKEKRQHYVYFEELFRLEEKTCPEHRHEYTVKSNHREVRLSERKERRRKELT